MNAQLVAEEFVTPVGTINLNAASVGPLPRRTIDALTALTRRRATPWTIPGDEQIGIVTRSRALIARLINAAPDEIALTPNTSWGLNVAARVLPVDQGQVILSHDAEFPSNVYPWMAVERAQGIRYERIPLRDGLPDHDALIARLRRGDVGLVALSWVSFLSGDRADLERIGDACAAHDAWLVVDAIQGVGAAPIDVSRLKIDMLACGTGKWLCSSWGTGFLYIRREWIDALEPGTGGWLSVRRADDDMARMLDYDLTYLPDARKFEVATLAYHDFGGVNASLQLLFDIGLDAIHARVRELTTRLIDGVASIDSLTLVTPAAPERRAGIVACRARDIDAVSARLAAAGIIHAVRGRGVLRLAPHFYNTAAEIDRALEVLDA